MACNCNGSANFTSQVNRQQTAYPLSIYEPTLTSVSAATAVNTACNPFLTASFPQVSAAEQVYTFNPEVTAPIPGSVPVELATVPSVNFITRVPSVSVPFRNTSESGFVSYFVRPTSVYVNTCK